MSVHFPFAFGDSLLTGYECQIFYAFPKFMHRCLNCTLPVFLWTITACFYFCYIPNRRPRTSLKMPNRWLWKSNPSEWFLNLSMQFIVDVDDGLHTNPRVRMLGKGTQKKCLLQIASTEGTIWMVSICCEKRTTGNWVDPQKLEMEQKHKKIDGRGGFFDADKQE